jgi:hypothetical protein
MPAYIIFKVFIQGVFWGIEPVVAVLATVAAIRYYSATPPNPLKGGTANAHSLQRGIHCYPPALQRL